MYKPLAIAWIFIGVLFQSTMAQSPNSVLLLKDAKSLFTDSLLTQAQYQILVERITKDSLRTRGELLVVTSAIVERDYIQTIIQAHNAKQPANKRIPVSKVGMWTIDYPAAGDSILLQDYVHRLQRTGIISKDVAQQLYHHIQEGRWMAPVQVLEHTGWATLFEEWLRPDLLRAYAEMLRDQQIISPNGYESLLIDLQAKRIRSGRQLLSYCQKAWVIPYPVSQATPEQFYRPLYEQIRQLVPELMFTNFQLKEVREPDPFRKSGHLVGLYASYQLAGQPYQSLAYQYTDEKSWMERQNGLSNQYFYWLLDRRFYQFINQALTDHHSPYRIHAVADFESGSLSLFRRASAEFQLADESKAGFLLLTQAQADAIRSINTESRLGPYLPISQESYTGLTTAEKEQAWRDLQEQDFLTGLTPLERANTYASLASDVVEDVLQMLRMSPNVVHSIEYDEIGVLLAKPYRQLTQELIGLSRGMFKPSRIQDAYLESLSEGETFSYGFNLKGKSYATRLIKQANRGDTRFLQCINHALADANVDGGYYDVGDEQMGEPIFLTKKQKQYLLGKQITVKEF
jgi:hypothetical protein